MFNNFSHYKTPNQSNFEGPLYLSKNGYKHKQNPANVGEGSGEQRTVLRNVNYLISFTMGISKGSSGKKRLKPRNENGTVQVMPHLYTIKLPK